jgi:hypothetical protein
MSDDVKSWNGEKGFVTRKSHINFDRIYVDVKCQTVSLLRCPSNEQCQWDIPGLTSL